MAHSHDSVMIFDGENGQDSSKVIEIDPSGDVYLVLGENTILRVFSKVLSLASKVFSAMLRPDFEEGASLVKNGSCQVALPEDDPKSMHVLCLLLHHHHPRTISYTVDADFLHRMAVLVDKYACADAMYSWAMQKVSDLLEDPQRPENGEVYLLYASVALDLPDRFREITRRMVYSDTPHLITEDFCVSDWGLDNRVSEMLPRGLLATISFHEKKVKQDFLEGIEMIAGSFMKPLIDWPQNANNWGLLPCRNLNYPLVMKECDCYQLGSLLWKLNSTGLWPLQHAYRSTSLAAILKKARQFDTAGGPQRKLGNDCKICETDLSAEIKKGLGNASSSFTGLCLDCVKHNSKGHEKSHTCRIKHEGFAGIEVCGL